MASTGASTPADQVEGEGASRRGRREARAQTPSPSTAARLWRSRWLTLAAGVGAAVPVASATVEGLREGATPTGDRAIILTRSWDVFSGHTPLVGQFSASSVLYDHVVHSLGPMLYWLLALPVRIDAAVAPAVAMALVNAVAVLVAVACARRRGGTALMCGAAVGLALMCGSFSPETLHDVWNPSAGLLPFTALLFLCWGLACGQRRLLPVAVAAASFAAQSELVFLAPSVAALALGMAGLLSGHSGRRAAWRWWAAALAVGVACWSAPVVEELGGHPGNLTLVAEAAFSHGRTIGARAGWRAVVHAVGVPPWWLTSPHDPFGRLADLRRPAGLGAQVSCVALLLALLAVLAAGIWRRRREPAWAAAIGLALCLSLAASTASTPSRPSLEKSLGYMLWVASPIGMWVWLTLGIALTALLARPLTKTFRRRRLQPIALTAGVGLAWAVGIAVAAGQGSDQDRPEYGPVKIVQAAVRRALAAVRPRAVLVTGSHRFTAFDFRAAVIYDLRRRGWRVYAPAASVRLGSWYAPPRGTRLATVWIFDERNPPRRGRTIERLEYGQAPRNTITVMVSEPGVAQPPTKR
jgi:hypothetical protein